MCAPSSTITSKPCGACRARISARAAASVWSARSMWTRGPRSTSGGRRSTPTAVMRPASEATRTSGTLALPRDRWGWALAGGCVLVAALVAVAQLAHLRDLLDVHAALTAGYAKGLVLFYSVAVVGIAGAAALAPEAWVPRGVAAGDRQPARRRLHGRGDPAARARRRVRGGARADVRPALRQGLAAERVGPHREDHAAHHASGAERARLRPAAGHSRPSHRR